MPSLIVQKRAVYYTGDICRLTGKNRSTLGRMIKANRWPKPIKIGQQNAWPTHIIDALLGIETPETSPLGAA